MKTEHITRVLQNAGFDAYLSSEWTEIEDGVICFKNSQVRVIVAFGYCYTVQSSFGRTVCGNPRLSLTDLIRDLELENLNRQIKEVA